MRLPLCDRCNQPRTTDQLTQGRCLTCRRKHTCARHEPGSAACYTRHACRCSPCRTAANRAKKGYRLRSPLTDATPAREHIAELVAAGHDYGWIGGRLGKCGSYVQYLAEHAQRTHPATVAAILAITPRSGGLIDATGTKRRIQALAAIGWPTTWLAADLGWTRGAVHHLLSRTMVSVRTAHAIDVLFERLRDTPPADPSRQMAISRTLTWAQRNHWARADQWDDIDNPTARPRPLRTTRPALEVAADVRLMLGTDSAEGIARRLGYRNVDQLAQIIGRRDKALADRLRATKLAA